MAEYLSPGVYVEEVDSGLKSIEEVSTSTAGFVGLAQRGPLSGVPQLVDDFSVYQRKFGGYLNEEDYGPWRYLPNAVEQFFNNGGSRCYVVRVLPGMDEREEAKRPAKAVWSWPAVSKDIITFRAANEGVWGNGISLSFLPNPAVTAGMEITGITGKTEGEKGGKPVLSGTLVKVQKLRDGRDLVTGAIVRVEVGEYTTYGTVISLENGAIRIELDSEVTTCSSAAAAVVTSPEFDVSIWLAGKLVEGYSVLSLENGVSGFTAAFEKSAYITVQGKEFVDKPALYAALTGCAVPLSGGRDCAEGGRPADLMDVEPYKGVDKGPGKRSGIPAFKDVPDVNILLAPGLTDPAGISELVAFCENEKSCVCILDMPKGEAVINELITYRSAVDSSYAAMYHPWLQVYGPLEGKPIFVPPSGAVAGIYARTDFQRGVHKAPANEPVGNCMGLEIQFKSGKQEFLNPSGINLIQNISGLGLRVIGARTCSKDGNWRYINVRRLFIFLEQSVYASIGWAVFEPNDQRLWSRVSGTISSFLNTQWRNGMLAGVTAEEAYFINIGKDSTMTQDDILNGRLICDIGVALLRPAEFVVFRVTRTMES